MLDAVGPVECHGEEEAQCRDVQLMLGAPPRSRHLSARLACPLWANRGHQSAPTRQHRSNGHFNNFAESQRVLPKALIDLHQSFLANSL
jgi:hypothetical protein